MNGPDDDAGEPGWSAPGSSPTPTGAPGWSAPGSSVTPTGAPGYGPPPSPPSATRGAPTAGPSPVGAPGSPPRGYAPGGYAPSGYPPAGYPPAGPSAYPATHWATALTAHRPGIIPLRPLTFGEILEGSFAAMRRNPRTFFGLAFLVSLAVVLVVGAVAALAYLVATSTGTSDTSDAVVAIGAIGGLTVLYLLTAITGVALTGILSYPVGEGVLGRKPSIGETWRRTRRMVPRLAGLCLILFIPVVLVIGGLVVLAVLAFESGSNALGALGVFTVLAACVVLVCIAIRLALATPALVLEDIGVVASLKRSWGLTAGRFWRTLGVLLVASILVGVVQQVLAFAFQIVGAILGFALVAMLGDNLEGTLFAVLTFGVSIVGGLLAGLLTQPFLAAVGALLYTDARIRKEGFDLALVRAVTAAPVAR